ncbi:HsmA family protein [Anaerofustis butyriciformans]|uniref:HsmA family protein n=1 Tax=Anaerofustis butyriciformans TaxID=3108533 RepID=UPI003F89CCEC
MSSLLIFAIIFMTLALTFYTIGVFGEKKKGILLKWHCIIFWFGFIFDTTGTTIMSKIAAQPLSLNLHSITGGIALLLMAFHALWASAILYKGSEKSKKVFHKFSIVVWLIWLIPYFMGMFMGMNM